MNDSIKIGFRFVILILAQVLLFQKIQLFGYLNPIIYILFVFTYPLKKEKGVFLFLSFLLGLSIDIFTNSGGINAAATLFIAFIRLKTLELIHGNNEIDYVLFTVKKLNFFQALSYITFLTFTHHFILFFLEYYKTKDLFSILGVTAQTTIFSTILIGLILRLTVNEKS